jgi:hypothetical protein
MDIYHLYILFFFSLLTLARGHLDLAGGHGPLLPPLATGLCTMGLIGHVV